MHRMSSSSTIQSIMISNYRWRAAYHKFIWAKPENYSALSWSHMTSKIFNMLCHQGQLDGYWVIGIGDGYEEFRAVPSFLSNSGASFSSMVSGFISDSSGDLSGREDSTNYLLIWKIPKLI
ncbi:unnamed protein product [Orchesella dallaii]|uniref:Uncharacterized protein n=1 Tax=Orchesella dallaii TaxID=48710 RepID=A0ABP1PWU7_9HEXA